MEAAVTRSSSHGRTPFSSSSAIEDSNQPQHPPRSLANDNNLVTTSEAVLEDTEADNLIDAVPFVSTVNKLARTPPNMTRKVIAVAASEPPEPQVPIMEPVLNGIYPEKFDNEIALEFENENIPPNNYEQPPPVPPTSSTYSRPTAPNTAASVTSTVSVSNLHYLAVKTQVTLKSPLEGHNLGPFHKPEEFLQRTLDNLASDDWESNVNGMAAVLRFARHHPEYLLVEYKPLLQLVMKHVKNLRSQVI